MGLFDKLKGIFSHKTEFATPESISNEEYQAYRNKIDSDFESKYDFYTWEGINAIPNVSENKDSERLGTSVDKIECYLWRKSAEHEKNGNIELAIACLRKANAIMPNSSIAWQQKDYMMLVRLLKKYSRYEEAKKEEIKIKSNIPNEDEFRAKLSLQCWQKTLQHCGQMKTDLVIMSEHLGCCGECAKYQGRVFSISGQNKRFPELPKEVFIYGGIHEGCRHSFGGFLENISIWNKKQDPIKYSNRPLIDDRSKESIAAHEQYISEMRKIQEREADRPIYEFLLRHLPESTPKSFGAFRRMKLEGAKKYLKMKSLLSLYFPLLTNKKN